MRLLRILLMTIFMAGAPCVLILAPDTASAQSYTVEDIVRTLLSGKRQATRSTLGGARGEPAAGQSMIIEFEGETHRLTLSAMVTLRTVAAALSDERLSGARIQIVGHAYIAGDPLRSQPVSARRAQTVAEHLIAFYPIDPSRLSAIGRGAETLIDPANPGSLANQRIEIVNLGRSG